MAAHSHPDQLDLLLQGAEPAPRRGAVVVARVAVAARKRLDAKPVQTRQVQRIDWFRVITVVLRSGYSIQAAADTIGVARTTLLGWKQGAEPRYTEGERLVLLWCQVTGQGRDQLPMVAVGDWWAYHGKA